MWKAISISLHMGTELLRNFHLNIHNVSDYTLVLLKCDEVVIVIYTYQNMDIFHDIAKEP